MSCETRESHAKAALLNHLRERGALKRAAVISELAVEKWARRADIVTVNGEVVAYEIKTAADRLVRLSAQIDAYSATCDRVYAVVATKHLNTAMSILPSYVGLKELVAFRGQPKVVHVRDAADSPNLDKISTLSLLSVRELGRIVRSEVETTAARTRSELELQAGQIDFARLRWHLRRALMARYRCSTNNLKRGSARRSILPSDLKMLSIWDQPTTVEPITTIAEIRVQQWLADLAATKAFGEIPDDIRALLGK